MKQNRFISVLFQLCGQLYSVHCTINNNGLTVNQVVSGECRQNGARPSCDETRLWASNALGSIELTPEHSPSPSPTEHCPGSICVEWNPLYTTAKWSHEGHHQTTSRQRRRRPRPTLPIGCRLPPPHPLKQPVALTPGHNYNRPRTNFWYEQRLSLRLVRVSAGGWLEAVLNTV